MVSVLWYSFTSAEVGIWFHKHHEAFVGSNRFCDGLAYAGVCVAFGSGR